MMLWYTLDATRCQPTVDSLCAVCRKCHRSQTPMSGQTQWWSTTPTHCRWGWCQLVYVMWHPKHTRATTVVKNVRHICMFPQSHISVSARSNFFSRRYPVWKWFTNNHWQWKNWGSPNENNVTCLEHKNKEKYHQTSSAFCIFVTSSWRVVFDSPVAHLSTNTPGYCNGQWKCHS